MKQILQNNPINPIKSAMALTYYRDARKNKIQAQLLQSRFQFFMRYIYIKTIETKKYVVVKPKILKNNFYCSAAYHIFSIISRVFSKTSEYIYKLKNAIKTRTINEFKKKFTGPRGLILSMINNTLHKILDLSKAINFFLVNKKNTVNGSKPKGIFAFNTWPKFSFNLQGISLKVQRTYYLVRNLKRKPWVPPMVWKKMLKRFKYNRKRLFKFLAWKKLYGQLGHFRFYQLHLLKRIRKHIFRKRKLHKKTPIFSLQLPTVCNYNMNYYMYNLENVLHMLNDTFSTFPAQTQPVMSRFNIISEFFLTLKRRYGLHFPKQLRYIQRAQYVPGSRVIVWGSAGKLGFHSNKRTTPYAAEVLGKYIGRFLKRRRIRNIIFETSRRIVKKIRSFFKGFQKAKLKIIRLYYKRKIMFGSIRKPKLRRV